MEKGADKDRICDCCSRNALPNRTVCFKHAMVRKTKVQDLAKLAGEEDMDITLRSCIDSLAEEMKE